MSIKTPRLIQDRCGVYYFRLIVPLSWRHIVKKTEIRRSLRTKDVSIARQAALLLSARMEAFMAGSEKSTREIADAALTELFKSNSESYKMLVRVYKSGETHIETDTDEEAKAAQAIVADLKKNNSGTVQAAMNAPPASRCGTHLEQAKEDFFG